MASRLNDEDFEETKAYKKAVKVVGLPLVKEILAKDELALKELIALNSVVVEKTRGDMEENSAFQEAAETQKAFKKAFKEAATPYSATIKLAVLELKRRKD